jgi:hypothetical protein
MPLPGILTGVPVAPLIVAGVGVAPERVAPPNPHRNGAAGVVALLRNGGRSGLDRVVPRSDGEGEFGEGDREPMLWVLIYAEFVVATSEVLHEGVSGADHSGRAQPFKTAHRP